MQRFYTDEKKRRRPLTPVKTGRAKASQISTKLLFKPITPGKTWTPAYKEIRRTKDVVNTLLEKLPKAERPQFEEKLKALAKTGKGTLAKRRLEAQREILPELLRRLKVKCFFCRKKVKASQQLTTHHKNEDHEDNRPANKAIAHERHHRQHHYEKVAPRNPPKSHRL